MSCPSTPDTPFNPTFAMPPGPGPLQPPKSPALRAAEALGLGLSTLSPPITPAPLAPSLPGPLSRAPSRAASPLPSRAPSPYPSRAPSPGPRALAPPPIEDAAFCDGDFELTSADNVRCVNLQESLISASACRRTTSSRLGRYPLSHRLTPARACAPKRRGTTAGARATSTLTTTRSRLRW
ncbi:hypothetical protein CC85DRAFT_143005 [Cutaneotrichosporon oleaginosum]|uniref:Uncharacterized protein n=1 Tax=Cutaneotrichosporon oleaginosum TaxID=879819 RepID=A0A0J1AZJ8_9TREE|nr:uncharacterized protein CC85DRAFT_143005 [Cutaneotrichosporon oleaginosum]KLT40764.1 hypothetical protein CC85DRAFT_143005 [Cutaneotrichosporon oleaginosum]TXT06780.1 hypothetical protein COLE_06111 [Cutaneotrichosporon oleaginosum]